MSILKKVIPFLTNTNQNFTPAVITNRRLNEKGILFTIRELIVRPGENIEIFINKEDDILPFKPPNKKYINETRKYIR